MITFNSDIDESILNYAFNNNVIRFYSNSALLTAKAELTFNGYTKTIYPHPDGSFYYNFREMLRVLAGRNGYVDLIDPNINGSNWFVDATDEAVLSGQMKIKIIFIDNTSEQVIKNLVFINGVVQIIDFRKRQAFNLAKDSSILVLNPLIAGANNQFYAEYWKGFPFDVSVYAGVSPFLDFKNTGNGTIITKTNPNRVERVYISDGRTDVGFGIDLNMYVGVNNIELKTNNYLANLEILMHDACTDKGYYIKWINSLGGWSYWYFDKGNETRNYSDVGEIQQDFENVNATVTQKLQIGREVGEGVAVREQGLTPKRSNLLRDMLESPAVYLFTGTPYAQNTFNDWVQIKCRTNSAKTLDAKIDLLNFDLTFELPDLYTRKI